MANTSYSLAKAFAAIENQLISSMIRNMKRHRAEETDEGIQWSQWQAEQLKALEIYRKANKKNFGERFEVLNGRLEELLRATNEQGMMDQEKAIINAIKNGFTGYQRAEEGIRGEFFRTNERKLNALVNATTNDMQKAETAVLRMANDQYRKIIYNAQVFANTGAGTYEQAVDMATKDMLSAGLNCIQYANGSRHTLSDYADMAIKTANKRAYLQGEGTKRQEWGEHLVIMAKRGNPCPKCLPFVGKILIDDVWSGGSRKDGKYPLMSTAIKAGLYHPRCKDSHTTYFPGITTAKGTWTKEELEAIEKDSKGEARQQYAEHQEEKYTRLSENALDKENQRRYRCMAESQSNKMVSDRRLKDDEGIFKTINNGQKDIIKPRHIINELNQTNIGKESLDMLIEEGVDVIIDYRMDDPEDRLGFYDRRDNLIVIHADRTRTIAKTAEIIVHEATHKKIGRGDFDEEVECFKQEMRHRLRRELTDEEVRNIIRDVKKLYPELIEQRGGGGA